ALDGRAALEIARRLKPDLVIMDIMMPEVDGIAAARILTEEKVAPVVLVTAHNTRDLVESAKEAGVCSYVVKPVSEAQLVPQIEIALARFVEFREMAEEVESVRAALETRKVVDRAKSVLMRTQGLTETDAYRHIQRTSMNRRRPMREVAEAILLANGEE